MGWHAFDLQAGKAVLQVKWISLGMYRLERQDIFSRPRGWAQEFAIIHGVLDSWPVDVDIMQQNSHQTGVLLKLSSGSCWLGLKFWDIPILNLLLWNFLGNTAIFWLGDRCFNPIKKWQKWCEYLTVAKALSATMWAHCNWVSKTSHARSECFIRNNLFFYEI